MKKALGLAGAALIGLLVLTGCGRNIDQQATHSSEVPGARALNRFCDGPTLIYYSKWESQSDEYEAMWPGWCLWNEQTQTWEYDPAKLKHVPAMRVDGNVEGDDK